MQTSYDQNMAIGIAGQLADLSDHDIVTGLCEVSAGAEFGVGVRKGSAEQGFVLPSATGQKLLGVTVHTHRADNLALAGAAGIPDGETNPLLRKGRVIVKVDGAVVADGPVFCRHTANSSTKTRMGAFRGDTDGVAQVTTVTPTSANSTLFTLTVLVRGKLFSFQVTSDSASSATEICDAFRTLMAADAAFTALVTASGTATLILTAVNKGDVLQVADGGSPGVLAVAETTAASTRADEVTNARFVTAASADGLAVLEINLP